MQLSVPGDRTPSVPWPRVSYTVHSARHLLCLLSNGLPLGGVVLYEDPIDDSPHDGLVVRGHQSIPILLFRCQPHNESSTSTSGNYTGQVLKGLGLGVQLKLKAPGQVLLLLLQLVRVLPSNAFLPNSVLPTHKVILGHIRTKRGLHSPSPSHFQREDHPICSPLHMWRLLSNKYSKGREHLTIPKNVRAM